MTEEDGEIAVLMRNGSQLIATFYESGVSLIASTHRRRIETNIYFINYEVQVPYNFSNEIEGLFGTLDGDYEEIKHYRRGNPTPYLIGITDSSHLYDFLLSCELVAC